MKVIVSNLPASLALSMTLMPAHRLMAQTIRTLYNFSATTPNSDGIDTNLDGANPFKQLVSFGNTLYGTTTAGGNAGNGSVFRINTDGTGFTNLYSFSATDTNGLNSDGADPYSKLVLSGSVLYGTAAGGGNSGNGTVFAIHTDGTGFTNLYSFSATDGNGFNSDGADPLAGVILSGNTLYGAASAGGGSGNGTVFAIHTDGTGFTNLYSFSATDVNGFNNDGANPEVELILSSNTLYGTAYSGGSSGEGTVFALPTDGAEFTNLYSFSLTDANGFNSDGANPYAALILSGNTLYGAAYYGGASGNGTIFALQTDGTGFTNLYAFSATDTNGFNSDGANPYALTLVGNTIFGTADNGGVSGSGTVFQLGTYGTNFTTWYSFSAMDGSGNNRDGTVPNGVVFSDDTLYGTTLYGGAGANGTVFALALPVPTIASPMYLAGGRFQMMVNGESDRNYTVLMSTNLSSGAWLPLLVTNLSGDSFLFIDPNATNRQRFYQVLLGP